MDIETIKTILTVAHCENYAEAARKLGYTPSVISKRIRKTEQSLGIDLFVRGHKSSRLLTTAACEAIMPDLRIMEDAWLRVLDTSTRYSGRGSDNTLRIGSLSKPWTAKDESLIADFIMASHGANVIVTRESWGPLIKGLLQGRYDVAFIAFNTPLATLFEQDQVELMERFDLYLVDQIDSMYLAVGNQFEESSLKEASFEQFSDYAISFNVDKNGDIIKNHLAPFLELAQRYNIHLNAYPLDTRGESAFFLARNKKIAIPQPIPHHETPGISYVKLTDWPMTISVYCAIPKGKHSPLVVSMIDFLRKSKCSEVSVPVGKRNGIS